MKKIALIATLALAAGMASAADFGARVGYNGGTEKNSAGVTVSDRFGALGAEAAFDRSTDGKLNVNRYSLVGAYDVAKVVGATVAIKVGGAYIDPSKGADGYAGLVGVVFLIRLLRMLPSLATMLTRKAKLVLARLTATQFRLV